MLIYQSSTEPLERKQVQILGEVINMPEVRPFKLQARDKVGENFIFGFPRPTNAIENPAAESLLRSAAGLPRTKLPNRN
jgi:hypothetical protein